MHAATDYDVLIMGGGLAGNLQARHLLRKIPGIRLAIVEPRSDDKIASIHKIGESTVEIAAIFMSKELGLVDYLLENHPPKCGLAFHWPRQAGQTDTVDDYFNIWPPRFPKVMTYQLHRGKFERDLVAMNREAGVDWIRGRVRDFEIGANDAAHRVDLKMIGADDRTVTCNHLVDAASRSFLTGKKTDNIRTDSEDLYGLNTGAAWVRVSGVDRTVFRDGADPEKSATSHYYATNHFMGKGHWMWMIPICTDTMTLSVGGMFHHDVIPGDQVGRKEKLLAFLKANHKALYDVVQTGEIEDFIYWKKPSHLCKQMFSSDRWYAIGDAAYFGDAFYSLGMSTVALHVTSVTELVRTALAGEDDFEEKRGIYDKFNVYFGETNLHLYRDHVKHTGHASAMSWRIYLEYMWWFGMWVPMFIGRWHLDKTMAQAIVANCEKRFFKSIYDDMSAMIDEGGSAGFIDPYRADQLALGYCPTQEHTHFLENAEFEPQRMDLYRSISRTYFFTLIFLFKFQWRAFGIRGLLRPRTWTRALRMVKQWIWIGMGSWRHKAFNMFRPHSRAFDGMLKDFESYAGIAELQPWAPSDLSAEAAMPDSGSQASEPEESAADRDSATSPAA